MKIFFLITKSEIGGAQRFILHLIEGMKERNCEFFVCAGEGDKKFFEKLSALKRNYPQVKLEIKFLENLKRVPGIFSIIFSIFQILSLLKSQKPNVLFLCTTTAGFLGSFAGRLYKIVYRPKNFKIIYRIGGWSFRDPRNFFLNTLLIFGEKVTSFLKDKIIVNSEIDKNLCLKLKIAPSHKIIKIYNGLDPKKLKFLPRNEARKFLKETLKIKFSEKDFLIGCIANFYKTKGLNYLIEAGNKLKNEISGFKIIIFGEGNLRSQLENLIKKYHLEENVFLPGAFEDAYQYLKGFDLFVLPSLKEGFPWVILEGMAGEIPILATNVGGIPEIIENEKEGILVEPKNSQLLCEKIKWFYKNPKKAKILSQKAKEKLLREFSLKKMVKNIEKVLRE